MNNPVLQSLSPKVIMDIENDRAIGPEGAGYTVGVLRVSFTYTGDNLKLTYCTQTARFRFTNHLKEGMLQIMKTHSFWGYRSQKNYRSVMDFILMEHQMLDEEDCQVRRLWEFKVAVSTFSIVSLLSQDNFSPFYKFSLLIFYRPGAIVRPLPRVA